VTGGERGVEVCPRRGWVVGDRARHALLGRHRAGERLRAAPEWGVEEVLAVGVEHVEDDRGNTPAPRCDPRRRDLERLGSPVGAQRQCLAVEHDPSRRERERCGGDLRQPRGEVVERARIDGDIITVAMDLDARAVELPVHRPLADAFHRLVE